MWQTITKSKSIGAKKLVASVVKEEVDKLSRGQRVVVSGLAFAKDKEDEDVVRAFLQAHNVSSKFTEN